jgi:Iron-containing redox enzyme
MRKPTARGPLSGALLSNLAGEPREQLPEAVPDLVPDAWPEPEDFMYDGDAQLALFCLYELHYGGLDGVADGWEWHPELLRIRARLEGTFESALRRMAAVPPLPEPDAERVAAGLFALTADDGGPSLSKFVAKEATDEQLREFLILRSVYQLKEADPHSWAIPRLDGRAKAALVEIQADEYGGGRPERMHSAMFAQAMRGAGLDDTYGAYIDAVPAVTLAAVNMMSLFGLNRRLRGAIVGHLAASEMTSSIPNKLYSRGFRRLGYGADVRAYFDEHVEADAVHEQIAGRDMAGGLAEAEPDLLGDIFFGAAAALAVDALSGRHQLEAWQAGHSALVVPAGIQV